jgi:hypothetical protein
MMAASYTMNTTAGKDSPAVESYWLTTVMEDRAESAPPPADAEETDR